MPLRNLEAENKKMRRKTNVKTDLAACRWLRERLITVVGLSKSRAKRALTAEAEEPFSDG